MGKRKISNYSEEFKKSSAKLASESLQSVNKTAHDLGINVSTLHGWVNKYHPRAANTTSLQSDIDLVAEVKRLEKEVARLKQERDILKKATAYFARDHS